MAVVASPIKTCRVNGEKFFPEKEAKEIKALGSVTDLPFLISQWAGLWENEFVKCYRSQEALICIIKQMMVWRTHSQQSLLWDLCASSSQVQAEAWKMQQSGLAPFTLTKEEMQITRKYKNQIVHGASKASACLRVRRYKHPLILLQFPHAEIICLLRLMSIKMIFELHGTVCEEWHVSSKIKAWESAPKLQ